MTFEELFVGSGLSHGTYLASRKSPAITKQTPATPEDYAAHLSGRMGLGLVPVRADGTCRFGAIDIDVDTIDHATLYQQVRNLDLPLTVCRSKSGGAHLYAFVAEPGVPGPKMRQQLESWAQRLGYAVNPLTGNDTELFPKQGKVGSNNLGNWINLPYFDAEHGTTRHAQGPDGPLALEEFLGTVRLWDGVVAAAPRAEVASTPQNATEGLFTILQQGPPCIEAGVKQGVPKGARNSFMFNAAIGARRAAPDDWREIVRTVNDEHCVPPLDAGELRNILNSVGRKATYEFQCTEGAISGLCNFQGCLRRPFGKGYKREKDAANFDQLRMTNLRKINTDPPRYVLEVNGTDLELDTDQLLQWTQLRRRVMERLDVIPQAMKQDRWELQLRELLAQRQDIDAPDDASRSGVLLDRVRDFMSRYQRSRNGIEDVLKDLPFKKDDRVLFRASGLFKFLSQYKLDGDPQKVYALLHSQGGSHTTQRVKGRVTAMWSVPYDVLQEQTEEFTQPEMLQEDERL